MPAENSDTGAPELDLGLQGLSGNQLIYGPETHGAPGCSAAPVCAGAQPTVWVYELSSYQDTAVELHAKFALPGLTAQLRPGVARVWHGCPTVWPRGISSLTGPCHCLPYFALTTTLATIFTTQPCPLAATRHDCKALSPAYACDRGNSPTATLSTGACMPLLKYRYGSSGQQCTSRPCAPLATPRHSLPAPVQQQSAES